MVVERISCDVQKYAWGKIGANSTVAKLAANACKDFELDSNSPYAELWMGTHKKAPAHTWNNSQKLSDLIAANPDSELGSKITSKFGSELPFLLKILSVDRALSIQAHPNKSAAEILHDRDPAHYPDANHKPEMCIALTEFTGLCGFRPAEQTAKFTNSVPELAKIIGHDTAQDLRDAARSTEEYPKVLKEAFGKLMNADKETVKSGVTALVARIEQLVQTGHNTDHVLGDLVIRLNQDFPGDVGIFVTYFLNHVNLKPGEAMFLKANLPHAYLSGDCVECMACSDNVVRAGLTPKFMDVSTLVEMLDYSPNEADGFKFKAESKMGTVSRFNPPVPDFAVDQIICDSPTDLPTVDSASITLVASGSGQINGLECGAGSVIYASCNEPIKIDTTQTLVAYRAFVA